MQRYHHRPLVAENSIRLLVLYPATDSAAPLSGSLIESDLNDVPPYHAVSYTWGCKTGSRPFLCDDEELLITPNCDSALRQFRSASCSRRLWIDSICINQLSILERNLQVQLMGSVFNNSISVLIWLGSDNDLTGSLFRIIERLATIDNREQAHVEISNMSK